LTLARLRLRRRWRPNSLEMLRDQGILVYLGAKVLNVQGRSGRAVSLRFDAPSANQTIESSDILVAAGRTPNTAGIGVEAAGVAVDARGYIAVNDRLETRAPVVWAIGECAGSPQFTHVSENDFRIIWDNLAGGDRTTRDRLVPYCMFTDSPLTRWRQEGHPPRRGCNLSECCAQLRRAKRNRPNSAPAGCHMDAAMHMTHGLAMSAGDEENGCGLPYRDAPAPPAVEHWCALASRWCVFLAWSLP
jgi:hypothetical protein